MARLKISEGGQWKYIGGGVSGISGYSGYSGISGYSGAEGSASGWLGQFYYAESLTESSTSNNHDGGSGYVDKVSLSVPSPIPGLYSVEWGVQMTNQSAGGDNWLKMADTITGTHYEFRNNCAVSYPNQGWSPYGGFVHQTLTSAAITFTISYCRHTAGVAYIKRAKIQIRRIN